jgi:hypothetical protein
MQDSSEHAKVLQQGVTDEASTAAGFCCWLQNSVLWLFKAAFAHQLAEHNKALVYINIPHCLQCTSSVTILCCLCNTC